MNKLMSDLQEVFTEETTKHIDDLKKAILSLDNDPDNRKLVEEVFKIIHALKGNSAMFGFEKIVDLLRHIKTVYNLAHNGEIQLSRDIFNVILLSVDHLKILLNDPGLTCNETKKANEKILNRIIQITKFNAILAILPAPDHLGIIRAKHHFV